MTGPRLTTYTWGEVGRRRVLLLHGSTSSASTWRKVGPALAERGWSVIAVDLPAHGRSPAAGGPLVPNRAAAAVTATVDGASFDLVVGHSFGAAVAVILLAGDRPIAARAVLEELPGPHSVDWIAEAASISGAAASAQAEPAAMTGQIRATQVRWADQDCQHAVTGLAVCEPAEIAEGLTRPRLDSAVGDVPCVGAGHAAAGPRRARHQPTRGRHRPAWRRPDRGRQRAAS